MPLETKEMGVLALSELNEDLLPLEKSDGYTICALEDGKVFSELPTRRLEEYNYGNLTRDLGSKPELSAAKGLGAVESCDEARAVVKAMNDEEGVESIPIVDPTPEELVNKIHQGETVTRTTSGEQQQGIVLLKNSGCTGFFISGKHILTAAHCLPQAKGSLALEYEAPGLSNRTDTFDFERHPQYESGHRSTDLAVLTRRNGDLAWTNVGDRDRDNDRAFRLYLGDTEKDKMLNIYGYGPKWYNGSESGTLRTGKDFSRIRLKQLVTRGVPPNVWALATSCPTRSSYA